MTTPLAIASLMDANIKYYVFSDRIHSGTDTLRPSVARSSSVSLTKGDKVEHPSVIPIIVSWGPIHFGGCSLRD